jgi:abhydrolase domain-containing protein 6
MPHTGSATRGHRFSLRPVLVRLFVVALCFQAAPVFAETTLETRSIHVDDTTWSYYEGGTGPTVVLVHGFSSNKDTWLAVAERLRGRFHLVIPDLPGWGASTRIEGGNYDIDTQAARLDAFIRALDLREVSLVGHSMGGAIVGVYAADWPGRGHRLVLIAPQGLSFDENDFVRELDAGGNPFVFDDRAGLERTARLVYLNPPAFTDDDVRAAVADNRRNRGFIETTLAQIRAPSQWLALDRSVGRLTVPVAGVGCRLDKAIDISALRTLREKLPTARTEVLEGCNHLPLLELPDETAKIVAAFVEAR